MLHPGKHDQTTGTMAQAMETAFLDQWPHFNGDLPLPAGKQLAALRLFFVAVAQGMVQHLRDHPEAFNVTTASAGSGDGSHTHPAEVASISTTGTTA